MAMKTIFGSDRLATIAREITKTFETIHQDTLENLCDWIEKNKEQQKGEFVIVLQGLPESDEVNAESQKNAIALLKNLLSELSVKQAVSLACKITGGSHRDIYAMALKIKDES